jgi:cytochrome c-type biogenesis protein CcmH
MERRVATPDPARRVKARLNRRRAAGLFLGAVLLAVAGTAVAAVFEPREFASAEEERRYKALTNELRCLVCQNQNIADSNAELASDLRELAYQMIRKGDSDEQALWLGPFLLGAGGVWLLWRMIHRRSTLASTVQDLTDDEKSRLKHLLAGDEVDAKGERDT